MPAQAFESLHVLDLLGSAAGAKPFPVGMAAHYVYECAPDPVLEVDEFQVVLLLLSLPLLLL